MKMITDKINFETMSNEQEKHVIVKLPPRKLCFYGFRLDASHTFFTCGKTLKDCRKQKEDWLESTRTANKQINRTPTAAPVI